MKTAIFYHHVLKAAEETGKPVSEILKILHAEGLEGVDINAPDADDALLEMLEKTGLQVSSLYRVVTVFSGETQKGIELVDKAAEIGCKTVMLLPGSIPEEMDKETALLQSAGPLREISDYGQKHGVSVTVEDYDGRTLFGTSQDMLYFADKAPNLCYTYDSGNFYTVEDPLEALEALKPKIRHVHLKDYSHSPTAFGAISRTVRSGEVLYDVPFGYGKLPAEEILCRLRENGYDGYMCLEHTNAEKMMEANIAAIRYIRSKLN
ncbi:MAG: sugar phosphate isomerase/epimerase [Ruminococcaceae bacterium]|nr:sugar phosphate isomerase/epimerase [Oscillospiraceae bacterium]